MQLALSESLPSLVKRRYDTAKAAGNLLFSPTQLSIIRTSSGVPFQLRYCPALAKKPTNLSPTHEPSTKKSDPFDNPSPDLLIADVPSQNPSHLLVLNKYPVIAEHFIIATKLDKPQVSPLEQNDLDATYACLRGWREAGHGNLFAFFNSGEHSGASQPHRHLQFLPIDQMMQGQEGGGWQLLLHRLLAQIQLAQSEEVDHSIIHKASSLPFVVFYVSLPSNPSPSQLHTAYKSLYDYALSAVHSFNTRHPNELRLHDNSSGACEISYNLALTASGMAICPRRRGGTTIQTEDGTDVGTVELNGTVLGGTLMVKGEDEWNALKKDPEVLDSLLASIGIPLEA